MSLRYGFFDSEITGYDDEDMPIFDRAESSDFLALFISKIISDGVLAFPGDCFQVIAHEGMTLKVRPGFGIIKGRFAYDIQENTVTLSDAHTSYKRIDRIVLRVNYLQRLCEIVPKEGVPAATPVPPELLQPEAGDYYELCLATVTIKPNQTAITQANITDTRYNSSVCGVVTQVIDHLETSDFYEQLEQFYKEFTERCETLQEGAENDFKAWFFNVKKTFSKTELGNLQEQIEVERERINNLAKLENGSTTGDAELQDIRIGTHGEVFQTAGEAVRTQIGAIHKEYAYIPITMSSSGLRLDTSIIESGYTIGETLMNNMIRTVESEGYCVYTREVKKGESLVFTNAFSMTHDSVMYVFDSDRIVQNVVYPQIIQRDCNGECIFGQDGYMFIKFNYSNIASGEFFYIKQPAFLEPLVLYANKAEEYLVDAEVGDEVIRAIMRSRNIHIRVPNADGNNYTAVYSPVLMYQLPNYMNEYVYLFFLNDGINGETGMPTFSQLKILTSHTYNMTPLI